jgi:putative membrane protein
MTGVFIRWLTLAAAIILTAFLLDGIQIDGIVSAFWVAAILGILNAFLRPIALLLTLPINILTLGLFTFVINALMLKIASAVIPGLDVDGFWTAIIGSLLISLISWLLSAFINERGAFTYIDLEHKSKGKVRELNDTIDLENKGDNKWE